MSDDKRMGNNPLDWIGKAQEPKEEKSTYEKSSKEGLKGNWTRATFIVREDKLKKLKDYAYTERISIKEAVDKMLDEFLKDKKVIERNDD